MGRLDISKDIPAQVSSELSVINIIVAFVGLSALYAAYFVSGEPSWVQSIDVGFLKSNDCLLYTSPSPRDATLSRMPSSA